MKKFSSGTKRRGATLAELCVVLAVIAVISVMVTSFTIVLNQKTEISTAKLNAMQDLYLIENAAEEWAEIMAAEGASFSAEEGVLSADVGGSLYKLSFESGKLVAPKVSGEPMICTTDTVSDISFALLEGEEGNSLMFCTVNYEIPGARRGSSTSYSRTFCIDPHHGELISGEGGNP